MEVVRVVPAWTGTIEVERLVAAAIAQLPRLPLDLRAPAEHALTHLADLFEQSSAELIRLDFEHLSAGTGVLYLGLSLIIPDWERGFLTALGAGDWDGLRRHFGSSIAGDVATASLGAAGLDVESSPA
jgi:hypothetical protein